MIWQNIILVSIGGIYALGTLYQTILIGIKKRFKIFEIILLYVWMLVFGLILMPLFWLLSLDDATQNPIPQTKTYTLNEENGAYYKVKLKALGFKETPYRISVDNIPYNGFIYQKQRYSFEKDLWVIVAIDKIDQQTHLRVSVYKNNKITKVLMKQLNDLFE